MSAASAASAAARAAASASASSASPRMRSCSAERSTGGAADAADAADGGDGVYVSCARVLHRVILNSREFSKERALFRCVCVPYFPWVCWEQLGPIPNELKVLSLKVKRTVTTLSLAKRAKRVE